MSSEKLRPWKSPGWPWELEVLALIFVILSIALPYYLQFQREKQSMLKTEMRSQTRTTPQKLVDLAAEEEARMAKQMVSPIDQVKEFVLSFVTLGIYITFVIMAANSTNMMSTPITHLLSPLIFAGMGYYRLASAKIHPPIVSGSASGILLLVLSVSISTFLIARVRMARHKLAYRDIDWKVSDGTAFSRSFIKMALLFRPLMYMPHQYRACPEGIVIEGWYYIFPISFKDIAALQIIHEPDIATEGHYFATNLEDLIQISLHDDNRPIYITPKDCEHFLSYCEQFLDEDKTQRYDT